MFWLLPAALVLTGIVLAGLLVHVDRVSVLPEPWINSPWLYSGGATGARTLLGAIASSTIGVAGTVFSITIAALSLAAGQMGPRLLRNFTRDRGNQVTLGTFLGTFCYALMVLRSVRDRDEGEFIPHLSLSVGILLAFICVGLLVFFVGHMAGRINVYTVIDLVSGDVRKAINRLMQEAPQHQAPDAAFWRDADIISDPRRGYLQHIDEDGLADWAEAHGTSLRLLARPGDYLFPGTAVAVMVPTVEGAAAAIREATAVGSHQISSADLENAIRQLVEVAVRALSPSINAPLTAVSVLDRLGAALCDAVPLKLAGGVLRRGSRTVLVVPRIDYGGLLDVMFHMIRQNARGVPSVLIRQLEVLTAVISRERAPERQRELRRHAGLVLEDAERSIPNPSDLGDVRGRVARFEAVRAGGPIARMEPV